MMLKEEYYLHEGEGREDSARNLLSDDEGGQGESGG